jgi:hypothetical protein
VASTFFNVAVIRTSHTRHQHSTATQHNPTCRGCITTQTSSLHKQCIGNSLLASLVSSSQRRMQAEHRSFSLDRRTANTSSAPPHLGSQHHHSREFTLTSVLDDKQQVYTGVLSTSLLALSASLTLSKFLTAANVTRLTPHSSTLLHTEQASSVLSIHSLEFGIHKAFGTYSLTLCFSIVHWFRLPTSSIVNRNQMHPTASTSSCSASLLLSNC